MLTIVEYLVIAAVIGAVVFVVAVFVFGRGEQIAPLPARTSPSELPDRDLVGDDVRRVRFGVGMRGYRMSDVDWTLDRLADEIDRLHDRIATLTGTGPGDDRPPDGDIVGGAGQDERGSATAERDRTGMP